MPKISIIITMAIQKNPLFQYASADQQRIVSFLLQMRQLNSESSPLCVKQCVICNTCKAGGKTTTKSFETTNLIRPLKHNHPVEHVQFEKANNGKAAKAKAGQSSGAATSQQALFIGPQYERQQ